MPDSSGKSQVGSFADDEAALKRGKGSVVGVLAAIVVAALAGLWFLIGDGDDERVYGELGRQINGLKQAHFDQFWGCALPGTNLASLKSNADVGTQLEGRASGRGQRYALHLRDECAPLLTDIEPTLEALIVPEDLRPSVAGMKTATSKLRGGVSGLISYLDDAELTYDSAAARAHIEAITRGWFDFRKAHAELNKVLKARLDAP